MTSRKAAAAKDLRQARASQSKALEFSSNLPTATAAQTGTKRQKARMSIDLSDLENTGVGKTNATGTGQFTGDALLTVKAELPDQEKISSFNMKEYFRNLPINRFYLITGFILGFVFWLIVLGLGRLWSNAQQIATDQAPKIVSEWVDGVAKRDLDLMPARSKNSSNNEMSPAQQRRLERLKMQRAAMQQNSAGNSAKVQRGGKQPARAESSRLRAKDLRLEERKRQQLSRRQQNQESEQQRAPSRWLPPKR
ncbi:MAG: hypothetical protein ACOH5I_12040 [Oligoflexus sp.]